MLRLTWYPFTGAGAWWAVRAERGRCGRDRAAPVSPGGTKKSNYLGLLFLETEVNTLYCK